jgi:DNA-binding ferritin-like protein
MLNKDAASELVMLLLNARTETHIAHLKTSSYSEHKALDDFYNEIGDLADRLAENLQGKCGILNYDFLEYDTTSDGKELMQAYAEYISEHRRDVTDATDVQNLIDEVMDLISRTNYKLNFLH